MREILFRGKRKDNGEWVEGFYTEVRHHDDDSHVHLFIMIPEKMHDKQTGLGFWEEVIPETVGQFTGLTDKNGKRIFEGDIFHLDDEIVAVVIFQNGCFRLEEYGIRGAFTESGFDECGGGWDVIDCSPIDWYTVNDMEIIGNIHDNPELLKGE